MKNKISYNNEKRYFMRKRNLLNYVGVLSAVFIAFGSITLTADAKWYTGNCGQYYQINVPDNLTNTYVNGNDTILRNSSGTNSLTIEGQYDSSTWNKRGYYGYVENLISFVKSNDGYITGVTEEGYGQYKVTWCLWGQDHAGYWRGTNGGCVYFDYAYPRIENHGTEIRTMWNTFELLGNTP